MKRTIIAALVASMLGGCAALQQTQDRGETSYATGISVDDTDQIAADLAAFLSQQFPPGRTTLALNPEPTLFYEMFADELASRGYGVATGEKPHDAIEITYYITLMSGGVLVRLKYQDKIASRYYRETETGLSGGRYAIGVVK